ncbi:MAG: caspase family protein [Bacteroidota bacterium]|nr:caspase family protein [Bacteroidota bacterium]
MPLIIHSQEFAYKEKKGFRSEESNPFDVQFSPFRNYFAITYSNNTIEVYDKNWRKVFEHQGNPESYAGDISFSPDEEYLAFSKYKSRNDVAILSLTDMNIVAVLTGQSSFINDLVYSHNGKYLATASYDKSVWIWDVHGSDYQVLDRFEDHSSEVQSLAFSFDDKLLASCANDSRIHIYAYESGTYKLYNTIEGGRGFIYQVLFQPGSYNLISANSDYIYFWNQKNKHYEKSDSLKGNFQYGGLAYSPTGDFLAAPYYREVRIWKMDHGTFREMESIYRHTANVFKLSFSEDGQFLCSSSADKTAYIWEVSGVDPSLRSRVAKYMFNELTLAQKRMLLPEFLLGIKKKIDPKLLLPKDEFETTESFNNRRQELAETSLSFLQEYMEKVYNISPAPGGNIKIPIQGIIGYNADRQIYKIRFMETEAGVSIPLEAARQFKNSWKKAHILAWKVKDKGEIAFSYEDFKLVHPVSGKKYPLIPLENPFLLKNGESGIDERRMVDTGLSGSAGSEVMEGQKVTRALLFATNIYDSYSELINPVVDASSLSAEFINNYKVIVELVENPTLNETVKKIREYAKMKYTSQDQLFIFFAGHGTYDRIFKEGYVISKDSKSSDETKTSYLSHSNLRTMINNIPCDHVFLVMDVCFGGTFDPLIASSHRGAAMYEEISTEDFIERKSKYKTRLYLTSGGNEYVPDGRPGHHSPFMRKFLEALRNYGGGDGIVTVNEILPYIEKVEPQPRYGEFGDNEPGSDFLFVVRK